jgi:hypothetical protein
LPPEEERIRGSRKSGIWGNKFRGKDVQYFQRGFPPENSEKKIKESWEREISY